MIVLMAGLPGTGKTTLARQLAARTSGRVLSKDEVRHALFAPGEVEYSSRQDDLCLQVMLETAGYLLEREPNRVLFLDGRPFSRALARVPFTTPPSSSTRMPTRRSVFSTKASTSAQLIRTTSGTSASTKLAAAIWARNSFPSGSIPKPIKAISRGTLSI
jgi:hypothetical protein